MRNPFRAGDKKCSNLDEENCFSNAIPGKNCTWNNTDERCYNEVVKSPKFSLKENVEISVQKKTRIPRTTSIINMDLLGYPIVDNIKANLRAGPLQGLVDENFDDPLYFQGLADLTKADKNIEKSIDDFLEPLFQKVTDSVGPELFKNLVRHSPEYNRRSQLYNEVYDKHIPPPLEGGLELGLDLDSHILRKIDEYYRTNSSLQKHLNKIRQLDSSGEAGSPPASPLSDPSPRSSPSPLPSQPAPFNDACEECLSRMDPLGVAYTHNFCLKDKTCNRIGSPWPVESPCASGDPNKCASRSGRLSGCSHINVSCNNLAGIGF